MKYSLNEISGNQFEELINIFEQKKKDKTSEVWEKENA